MLYLKKIVKPKQPINICTRLKTLRILSRTNLTQTRCMPFESSYAN